jgi:hypothetical protein
VRRFVQFSISGNFAKVLIVAAASPRRSRESAPPSAPRLSILGWVIWERAGGSAQVGDADEALLATMVFTSLAFVQLARALATRSFREPIWRTGLRGNRVLVGMVGAALILQLGVVYLPFAQDIFGTTALTVSELGVGAGIALAVLAALEVDKALRRRTQPPTVPPIGGPPSVVRRSPETSPLGGCSSRAAGR